MKNIIEMQTEKTGMTTSKTESSTSKTETVTHHRTETKSETKEKSSFKMENYHAKEYDKDNVFQKIIRKEIIPQLVLEDEHCIAFKDINPQASTHVVVIPKCDCVDFGDFVTRNHSDVGHFFGFILKVIEELKLKSYRLITNSGKEAGQSVFHFHMHILSGELTEELD